MKSFLVLLIPFILISCADSSSSVKKTRNGLGSPNSDCSNILSEDDVKEFNRNSDQYRIDGTGFRVSCSMEKNINGKVTKFQKSGHSDVLVYPNLTFVGVEKLELSNETYFKFKSQVLTREEQEQILKTLGFKFKKKDNLPISDYKYDSLYFRLRTGTLFGGHYNSEQKDENGELITYYKVFPESDFENSEFELAVNSVGQGEAFQFLRGPEQGQFYAQTFISQVELAKWTNLDGVEVLRSSVKELNSNPSRQVLIQAIDRSLSWNLMLKNVHSEMPELFNFSESEWRTPNFNNDEYKNPLFDTLKYLVRVNPHHPIAQPVQSTYEKIEGFFKYRLQALKVSYEYAYIHKWNEKDFSELLNLSQLIGSGFNDTWSFAEYIRDQFSGNIKQAQDFARLTGLMVSAGLASTDSKEEAFSRVQEKMAMGLNQKNQAYYFSTLNQMKNEFSASYKDSELIADKFVLENQVPQAQFSKVSAFMKWVDEESFLSTSDAVKAVFAILSQNGKIEDKINLFKETYKWLDDETHASSEFEKTISYFQSEKYNELTFKMLKDFYKWLTNEVSISTWTALDEAEKTIIQDNFSVDKVSALKGVVNWMMKDLSMYSTSAFSKGKEYINKPEFSYALFTQIKDFTMWQINVLSKYASTALAETESVWGSKGNLDKSLVELFKTQTKWYTDVMSKYNSSAYDKVKMLILEKGLTESSAKVLRDSGSWLLSEVNLYASQASDKAEAYVFEKGLDNAKFLALKAAFKKHSARNYNSEALRLAELEVLGLN